MHTHTIHHITFTHHPSLTTSTSHQSSVPSPPFSPPLPPLPASPHFSLLVACYCYSHFDTPGYCHCPPLRPLRPCHLTAAATANACPHLLLPGGLAPVRLHLGHLCLLSNNLGGNLGVHLE